MPDDPPARHILSFAQTLAGGGVERALLRLAGHWTAAGRRVTILVGSRTGPLAGELPAAVDVVALNDARYTALLRAAPGVVRAVRPDILFAAGNHYSAVAAWARLRLGRECPPVVAKISNRLTRGGVGYAAWLRAHPRFLDAVVAMTPGMADEAVATMRIARDRVHVIANPPAVPLSNAAQPALPAGRYLIGVGRLVPQKRWDRAVAALAVIADREIPLVILGEGAERAALVRQAAALGVSHRLLLPGHAADPLPAIAGAVALVLTSDYEGVPGVLREALSVGTPVIATDASVAVREIVTRADQGSVVAVGDQPALVAAIDGWAAPGRARPAPTITDGDPAADYLALFDSLASSPAS